MTPRQSLRNLAAQLARGEISYEALIADKLDTAKMHPDIFVSVNDNALETAREFDQKRQDGALPAFAGVPVTLKDLFDVKGEFTQAGSTVLKDFTDPAERDADVVAPLRDAGMLFLGRTNMSEFAFSGMGLNPHYPPLYSVWDRATRRLPGGSSSGSAVSVALDIVPGTLGSDTAGSCRIPAAFNGIVGVKPSYGRLSLRGIYPLSPSSDAPGPLAADVDSCFVLDHLMAGGKPETIPDMEVPTLDKMRLLVPEGVVLEDLDDEVQQRFDTALDHLAAAGVTLVRQPLDGLDQCVEMFSNRSVVGYEAWQNHKAMLEASGDGYDPFVRKRISASATISEADQQTRYNEKAGLIERVNTAYKEAKADAVIYPTVACVPPPVASTDDPDQIGRVNLRCLRNTASVNYFDGCSVSLPCHRNGDAPVGLMVSALHGQDRLLYGIAAAMEDVVRS